MNTKQNFSTYTLLVSLVTISLIIAGCSAPKPAPTPVTLKPTLVPTKPQPTIAPTQPKPTATPIVVPTTEPVTNSISLGKAQIINNISITPSTYELLPESGSDKPTTDDQYLVVTFLIENTSKTANFSFDPTNMVILDPNGTERTMVSLKSLTNELTTQLLQPGAKLNSVIAFEIPQHENTWTLEFKGDYDQNLMWPNNAS